MKGSPQKDVGLDAQKAARPLLLGVKFLNYESSTDTKRNWWSFNTEWLGIART
jgi:hypothetical protein